MSTDHTMVKIIFPSKTNILLCMPYKRQEPSTRVLRNLDWTMFLKRSKHRCNFLLIEELAPLLWRICGYDKVVPSFAPKLAIFIPRDPNNYNSQFDPGPKWKSASKRGPNRQKSFASISGLVPTLLVRHPPCLPTVVLIQSNAWVGLNLSTSYFSFFGLSWWITLGTQRTSRSHRDRKDFQINVSSNVGPSGSTQFEGRIEFSIEFFEVGVHTSHHF